MIRLFRSLILFLLLGISFASCTNFFQSPLNLRDEVSIEQASEALSFAQTRLSADYVWGGNGPDIFDCSGLIVWSYQQTSPYDHIFSDGNALVDDVNMQSLFNFNVRALSFDEIQAGDIIFITNSHDSITHGGMVIDTSGTSVTFIHASSYSDEVTVDTWDINLLTRGQWIEGFGRMIIRN